MKTLQRLLLLTLAPLLLANQCKKDNYDTLPPETQEGKNTFGCYVDGELFVKQKEAIMTPSRLFAEYRANDSVLLLGAHAQNLKQDRLIYITMEVKNPKANTSNIILLSSFGSKKGEYACGYFIGREVGEIFFTRFDTINRIVSGRFHFPAQCANIYSSDIISDYIVVLSDGRFDAKLDYAVNYD